MPPVAALLDLVLGRRCLECARPGAVWCDDCVHASVDLHRMRTPAGHLVHAAARYSGAVRDAILAHKEQGQLALATPLGRLLATVARGGTEPPGTLVPVPSNPAVVRARGHDHARRLAGSCGAALGVPVVPALTWSRDVADQAGLSVAARRRNVASGMTVRRPERLRQRLRAPVWVVDDVATSGSTLDEAARALASAGWAADGLAVVAAVEARTALAAGGVLR